MDKPEVWYQSVVTLVVTPADTSAEPEASEQTRQVYQQESLVNFERLVTLSLDYVIRCKDRNGGLLPVRITKKKAKAGRPLKSFSSLNRLKSLGIFRLSDAKKAGLPRQSLARMVQVGEIIHLEHDLYRHRDAGIDPAIEDFAVACARFGPESVIGGLSALFYHHITDQAPKQVWVLVPSKKLSRIPRYRCLRTKTSLSVGTEDHDIFRITDVERSIAEAFRYATKLGLETAVRAARIAMKSKLTTPTKILRRARELDLEAFVMKHWEAISVE
jgi:hypothetical protein